MYIMSVHELENFWLPGQTLDHLYPEVAVQQLNEEFASGIGGEVMAVGNVLGTMRVPEENEIIRGVASVDLCEILRETARSLVSTNGNQDYYGNGYIDGLVGGFCK